jgi:hypothetical protein
MTDKERFDALMKLAELKSNIREKRRDVEWKVSIGLWAITGGAVAYLKGHSILWSLVLVGVVVFMHSWLWVRTNYNSSERDAKQVYYYVEHASRIVMPESVASPGDKLPRPIFGRWEFLRHEPIWFEIAITPVLGVLVVLASR